jgi:hypothetical protein
MDDLGGAIEDLETVLASGRERDDQGLVVKTLVEISRIARWLDSRYCLETAAEAEAISRELDDEFIKVCARVNCARANLFFAEWRQDSVATCRSGFRVVRAVRDPSMIVPALSSKGAVLLERRQINRLERERLGREGAPW